MPRPPSRGPNPRGAGPRGGAPTKERMAALLRHADIVLDEERLDKLWHFHRLLREGNRDRDLTRIVGFESMVVKHYVDCMMVGQLYPLPSPLLDVGTGAGFPGIPLKIRYPQLQLTLAEPRPRRVEFLKSVIRALPLAKIDVFDHRVVSRSFTRKVAGVITRAVETVDKTLLRTSACTGEGSRIVFMKGPAVDRELEDALERFRGQFRLILDKAYTLPGTPHQRRLVVLEKLVPAAVTADAEEDADIPDAEEDGD
jgi:16S rRNA (guanine(527)-N(7))-methyltransferase RsmG